MNKTLILFLVVLCSVSCQKEAAKKEQLPEKSNTEIKKKEINQGNSESETAKKWLVKTILTYFKNDISEMSGITTKTYEEYKSEATNVEMDTDISMTQEEFENKWKNKYDTKYAGIGGFLISAQDWGKIEVTKCNLLSENMDSYVFEVIISDTDAKADYKRDIKVIKSGKSFLIDDVKEYN